MDASTIDQIAVAVIQRRVNSAVENRVKARGGTKADEAKVKKAIAQKLG